MATDTVKIQCPSCKERFNISVYTGPGKNKLYGIGSAPLSCLAEIQKASKEGTIMCIHCSISIAIQVSYAVYVRPLSCVKEEGWVPK